MNRIVVLLAVLVIASALGADIALADNDAGNSYSFKWFRDDDGDGIPNGQDDDWTGAGDGTGYQLRHGFGVVLPGAYIRLNGEGNYNRYQKRNRHQRNDGAGDCTMERKRLRDGSCL